MRPSANRLLRPVAGAQSAMHPSSRRTCRLYGFCRGGRHIYPRVTRGRAQLFVIRQGARCPNIIDHPCEAWQHPYSRGDRMLTRFTALKVVLLSLLVLALAVPPGSLRAFAGQEGPQKAPPDPQSQGQQKPSVNQGQKQNKPEYSIQVESPLVQVDAVVTDQDGNILTGLEKRKFPHLGRRRTAANHQFLAHRCSHHRRHVDGIQQAGLFDLCLHC